ncbi:MAG: hypothetical protein OHK0021_13210 [Bryobacter sp.]
MSETRRKFTREFKLAAVMRLQSGYSVARLARELEVNASPLHLWKRQYEELQKSQAETPTPPSAGKSGRNNKGGQR